MRSATLGGQHHLTSEVPLNPEVTMSPTVAFPDFFAGREHAVGHALSCTVETTDVGPVWVHLVGELDISSACRLEHALHHADASGRTVVLDLRRLRSVDSSSVQVIVEASTRARQAKRRLMLIRGPSQVDRALALSGAADVLDIVDLDPPEPPAGALRQFARTDDAA